MLQFYCQVNAICQTNYSMYAVLVKYWFILNPALVI